MFWSLVNASVTGAKASLTVFSTELVSVVMGSLHPQVLSYGLTPSGCGPGQLLYGIVNGATQHSWCTAISRMRDRPADWANCPVIRHRTCSIPPQCCTASGSP